MCLIANGGCVPEQNPGRAPPLSRTAPTRDTVEVPIPPEVSFDRYFRGLTPSEVNTYQGKHDLEGLGVPNLKEILLKLQRGFNFALANERHVPEHRNHPPFHVDYIKSDIPNALAFRHDGYSFIGLTIPLITAAMELCGRLSRSAEVVSKLGLELTEELSDSLGLVLFRIIAFFIVSHEYTHIVHGHPVSAGDDSMRLNEILDDGRNGSPEAQTLEADADSYAIYHIMGNWVGGVERSEGLSLLKMEVAPVAAQDDFLFACVVTAIGAYFLLRPVPHLNAENVYKLTHPPQPARLDSLMETAIGWCQQNRPELEKRMPPEKFDALLSSVAGLIWGSDETRSLNWTSQLEFLRSSDGAEYIRKLRASKNEYRASL